MVDYIIFYQNTLKRKEKKYEILYLHICIIYVQYMMLYLLYTYASFVKPI